MDIVPFSKEYDRSGFCCGKALLDDWLKTQASQQERAHNTRTFLAVDGHKVVGYFTAPALNGAVSRLVDELEAETGAEAPARSLPSAGRAVSP